MNDTIANKAVTEAQEAYKAMLEAHDAEVRQTVIAEIRDRLIPYVARLKEAAKLQLEAAEGMETLLMDKPATPGKRHRTRLKATKAEVESVTRIIHNIGQFTSLPVEGIAKMANLEPGITANACEQLAAQGWIKGSLEGGYAWISEQEAEKENGLRTGLDDGPEIE